MYENKDESCAEMFKKLKDIHLNGNFVVKVKRTRVQTATYHKEERERKTSELEKEIEGFYTNN